MSSPQISENSITPAAEFIEIDFNGDKIVCFSDCGNVFVAIKTIADAIGLDSSKAQRTLKEHEILGELCAIRHAVGADDKRREMLCLPLKRLAFWLATIPLNRVSELAKPNLKRYQLECADVLYTHFFGNKSENDKLDAEITELYETIDFEDEALFIHKALKKQAEKRMKELMYQRFAQQSFHPAKGGAGGVKQLALTEKEAQNE